MTKKRKKKSIILRILLGLWLFVHWVIVVIYRLIKYFFIGLYNIILLIYNMSKRRIEKKRIKRKIEENPVYQSKNKYSSLISRENIEGDFNDFEKNFYENSLIGLIFGRRGSGKSALGFRILENISSRTRRECYALGVDEKLLPRWIKALKNIDEAKSGGVVLVDEGAISFGARDSMSSKNKGLTKLLVIARHKNLSVLVVTQNTGLIDKNILALSDVILIKEGSLLQKEMERSQMKKFYDKASAFFSKIKGDRRKYAYIIESSFEGLIEAPLPSFWTENLSKSRAK